LRINNGKLEISNNRTNWYQVFPALGKTVEVIANDANTADNFKIAYLTPGQTLLVRGKNLARAAAVEPSSWIGNFYITHAVENWIGIFPSNIAITDGWTQWIQTHSGSSVYTNGVSSFSFVPIADQGGDPNNWDHFSIQIVNNKMLTTAVGHGYAGISASITVSAGSFPSNGYFLGSLCSGGPASATRINVDYLAITRQG
jgi:hypothetical protein